jgi:hypothetical protein
MSTPEIPDLTGVLLAQAQQGQRLAELNESLAQVDGRLGELQTVLVGVRGTQAAQGEILGGLQQIRQDLASLRNRVNAVFPPEQNDGSEFYDPPPSIRVWEMDEGQRTEVIQYLDKWVTKVWVPTFGYLAAKLPPCWKEHWLCITVIDVLSELHKVLWCQPVRLAGTLSGQAELLTRLAPALAEVMATERKGCVHERAEQAEVDTSNVVKYGRTA